MTMHTKCLFTGKRGSQSAPPDAVVPQQDNRLVDEEQQPIVTAAIIKSGGAGIHAVATMPYMSKEPSISKKTDSSASENRGKGERYFSS